MPQDSPADWPLVARDEEMHRALAVLTGPSRFRGVALLGESGVGKSTLARNLADALERRGETVRFVLGTRSGRGVPLGAFSRTVVVDQAHAAVTMLSEAHRSVERLGNPVIVVDDAQLLDPLSATLVTQIAAERTARLVVTARTLPELPDSVSALLREEWLLRLRVGPLTREQTAELARTALGDAVAAKFIDVLHERTAGNLLLLCGLLRTGYRGGALVRTETGWHLRGPLHPDRELQDALQYRLQELPPEDLAAVEILAVADALDFQILSELCTSEVLERLERSGLIQLVADGPATVAMLNHPLLAEAAVQLAGVVRTRKVNAILANAFRKHLPDDRRLRLPDVRGHIRLAQFMMRSDLAPDLDLIVAAAEEAIMLANVTAGEELARFALHRGSGLPAALVLAEALRWEGHYAEAESVLAEFDPRGDDLLTARWACLRATNLFEGQGRTDEAARLLSAAATRVTCGPGTDLIAATDASFTLFSAHAATAAEAALALLVRDTHPAAKISAVMVAAWALARIGRFSEIPKVVEQGARAAAEGAPGAPAAQLLFAGLAEAAALTAAGELPAAERVVSRYGRVTNGVPKAEAIIDSTLGYIRLAQGQLAAAGELFRRGVPVLETGFQASGLLLAGAWWAQAEGAQGNAEAAAEALRYAEQAYGPQVAVFLPDLELGRAWVQAAQGAISNALQHTDAAARAARRGGMATLEVKSLHTAVRFGDRRPARRLSELARSLDTPLPRAIALHAAGLAARDGAKLAEAADRFADLGAMALAADALAQAAAIHGHAGDHAAELAASERAHEIIRRTGLRSPATTAIDQPLPLTKREREIAALASAGMSSRDIADRLGVSVRTVDGHLYRVFGKLGINRRTDLPLLTGGGDTRGEAVPGGEIG